MIDIIKTLVHLFIKALSNSGIQVLVGGMINIIVLLVTIRYQNINSRKQLDLQAEHFKSNLESVMKRHEESLYIQNENMRVSQLPFLFLNQDIKLDTRGKHFIFPLKVTNLGNGVALDIRVVTSDDCSHIPYVYKNNWLDSQVEYYQYTGYMFTDVLPVNNSSEFEIALVILENGSDKGFLDTNVAGNIKFSITYKDTYYNNYKQDYFIQYSAQFGIGRIESYLPVLYS